MTDGESVSVFGLIGTLNSQAGTAVFICFLLLTVCLEKGFHAMLQLAEYHGLELLFHKLQSELMVMGVLSFCVLIYNVASQGQSFGTPTITEAFEMAHIIFFAIALAFVFQAFFLVLYALTAGKRYLKSLRTTSAELLGLYEQMREDRDRGVLKAKSDFWWFHKGNPLFPTLPAWRFDVEYRIIERFFIYQHDLSVTFCFAKYNAELFKHYLAELGEHHAVSWLLLALLVALNYFRSAVLDPVLAGPGCKRITTLTHETVPKSVTEHSGDDSHSSKNCQTYLLFYGFIVAAFLTVSLWCLYYAAVRYEMQVLRLALQADGIDTNKKNLRYFFPASLKNMVRRERMLAYAKVIDHAPGAAHSTHAYRQSPGPGLGADLDLDLDLDDVAVVGANGAGAFHQRRTAYELLPVESPRAMATQDTETSTPGSSGNPNPSAVPDSRPTLGPPPVVRSPTKIVKANVFGDEEVVPAVTTTPRKVGRSRFLRDKMEQRQGHNELLRESKDFRAPRDAWPSINTTVLEEPRRPGQRVPRTDDVEAANDDGGDFEINADAVFSDMATNVELSAKEQTLHSVFACGSPWLFFRAVDSLLLMQCFFIAIVFTQFVPMISEGDLSGGWIVGFLAYIFANFYIIMLLLNKAVILRAVFVMDVEVVGTVLEDEHELQVSLVELRNNIFTKLEEARIPPRHHKAYLHAFFSKRGSYREDGVLYLTQDDFHRILRDLKIFRSPKALEIMWNAIDYDLGGYVEWDEMEMVFWPPVDEITEAPSVTGLRERIQTLLSHRKLPLEDWEEAIRDVFDEFDTDKV